MHPKRTSRAYIFNKKYKVSFFSKEDLETSTAQLPSSGHVDTQMNPTNENGQEQEGTAKLPYAD